LNKPSSSFIAIDDSLIDISVTTTLGYSGVYCSETMTPLTRCCIVEGLTLGYRPTTHTKYNWGVAQYLAP